MSPVDICNIALTHIGDRRIYRLDAEAQEEDALVAYCAQYYELAKKQALAAHRWTFAKDVAVLSQESNPVIVGDFNYSFVLPVDMLRLMNVYQGVIDSSNALVYRTKVDDFKIMSGKIWTNCTDVAIEYISNIDDPTKWTPHFQAAVSRLLAHYLAGVISNSPEIAKYNLDLYERNDLPNAQFYDSVQDNSGEGDDLNVIRAQSPLFSSHRSTNDYGGY